MNWQNAHIQAAATFLRERMAAGDTSPRTREIYEGLLDVLDPARRAARVQREMAMATKVAAAAAVKAERHKRTVDRRRQTERRKVNLGSPTGVERRRGIERRSGTDRRRRS
jgi:hypothetical protein